MSLINVAVPHRIVRATIPLKNGHVWKANSCPFVLVDESGRRLPTQWERVALAADNQNVRIAELIAIDNTQSGRVFDVQVDQNRDNPPVLSPWSRSFLQTPPTLHVDGIPLPTPTWAKRLHRNGPVAVTRRFGGSHIVGWITAYAGCNFVVLNLKIHNASPQSGPWLFNRLKIDAQNGTLIPFWHLPYQNGNTILDRRSSGHAHAMPARQKCEMRFVVVEPGQDSSDAIAYMRASGFGVSDQWSVVEAWGPEQLRLPNLTLSMKANMVKFLRNEDTRIAASFVSGAAIDLGASLGLGRIGIGHTTGGEYGGVTGGGGRWLSDKYGVMTALTGDPAGLRALQGKAAQLSFRMPALYETDGSVCQLKDWLDANGDPKGGWEMSGSDPAFERDGGSASKRDGAFGFFAKKALAVPVGMSIDAAEYDRMERFDNDGISSLDYQHYVRAITAQASLTMLGDEMAGHELRSLAEAHRMSMFTQARLSKEHAFVTSHKALGTVFGRGPGHGFSAQAAAYYVSGPDWRTAREAELASFVEIICEGQMPNGCLQTIRGNKEANGAPFNKAHGIQKATEAVILAFAAHQIDRLVNVKPFVTDEMLIALADVCLAQYHGGRSAVPYDYVAVQPADRLAAPYTDPPVWKNRDRTEVPTIYGLALLACVRTGFSIPPALWAAIRIYCGGAADPQQWLRQQSEYKLELDDTLPLLTGLEQV